MAEKIRAEVVERTRLTCRSASPPTCSWPRWRPSRLSRRRVRTACSPGRACSRSVRATRPTTCIRCRCGGWGVGPATERLGGSGTPSAISRRITGGLAASLGRPSGNPPARVRRRDRRPARRLGPPDQVGESRGDVRPRSVRGDDLRTELARLADGVASGCAPTASPPGRSRSRCATPRSARSPEVANAAPTGRFRHGDRRDGPQTCSTRRR